MVAVVTKQEEVWALNARLGEDRAYEVQRRADTEKAQHFEQWFKKDVLGHRSSYQEDDVQTGGSDVFKYIEGEE